MAYDGIIFTDGNVRHWHVKPLGPQRIATELRKNGYRIKVIDFFSKWITNKDEFLNLISLLVDKETLFIGFSGTFFNKINDLESFVNIKSYKDYSKTQRLDVWPIHFDEIDDILKTIRSKYPDIKFIYGGDRLENNIKHLENSMDFIVKGYGETTILEIVENIKFKKPLKFNITSGKAKLINHDIDAVNFNFREHSRTEYTVEDHVEEGDVVCLETSRGCMFRCTFCSYPILGRDKNNIDYHKSEDVLENEFRENFQNFKINKYIFTDNILNETTSKLETLLRIRDKSKVDINFVAFIRYEILNKFPEQISLLKELGIQSFMIGIESLHLPSAKLTGKGTDPEKVKDILYKIKDSFNQKINITGSFTLGLPEDNPNTLDNWMPWLGQKECPIDGLFMYRMDFHNLGSSIISDNAEKFGYTNITYKNGYSYWKNKYWSSIDADRYMKNFLENCYQTGRMKLTGFHLIGFQSKFIGYSFDKVVNMSMRDLNFSELTYRNIEKFQKYKDEIFKFELQNKK